MRVTSKNVGAFKPVEVTIKLESPLEVLTLWHLVSPYATPVTTTSETEKLKQAIRLEINGRVNA